MLIFPAESWRITSWMRQTIRALHANEPRGVEAIAVRSGQRARTTTVHLSRLTSVGMVATDHPNAPLKAARFFLTPEGADLQRLVQATDGLLTPTGGHLTPTDLATAGGSQRLTLAELRERNGRTVDQVASRLDLPAARVWELEADWSPRLEALSDAVAALDGELFPLVRTSWEQALVPAGIVPLGDVLHEASAVTIADHLRALHIEAAAGGDGGQGPWVARCALGRERFP